MPRFSRPSPLDGVHLIQTTALISSPVRLDAFIGRERERAFFAGRLDATAAGAGSIVTVTAPAGMGKTRLGRDILDAARARGQTTLDVDTRLAAKGVGVPFAIAERLETLGLVVSPAAEAIARGRTAQIVSRLVELAASDPVVMLLDDLHEYDEADLGFVEMLLPATRRYALLAVLTARAEERARRPLLDAAMTRFESSPGAFAVRLGPLRNEELGPAMLAATRRRRPLTARVRDDILERAAGNPFHVEELLRTWVDGYERPLAPTAAANVALRFANLRVEAQRFARVAAILGRRFDLTLVDALLPLDASTRADVLRDLRDSALLHTSKGVGSFEHALAHEAILATLVEDEARALHRAAAAALAARGAAPVERAAHALAAEDADAVDLAEAAGDELFRKPASREAAAMYEAALGRASGDDRRASLYEKAALANERAGQLSVVAPMLDEAIALHVAAERFDAALHDVIERGRIAHNAGRFDDVERAYRRVKDLFPDVTPERRLRAVVTFALLFTMSGRIALGRTLAAEAESLPIADDERVRFHRMRALVRGTGGDPRWRDDADVVFAGLEPGPSVARANALNLVVQAAARALDNVAASAYADSAVEIARTLGHADMISGSLVCAALHRYDIGRLHEARALLLEAIDVRAERMDGSTAVAGLALALGVALRDDALINVVDFEALRSYVRRPLGPSSSGPNVMGLSLLYERDARTSLHRSLLDAFATTVVDAYGAWAPLARTARFGGEIARAAARTLLERSATELATPLPLGYLALFDAYDAARGRKRVAARAHGLAAAAQFARAGMPLARAHALEAAGSFDEAHAILAECGALYDADRVRARASHAGSIVVRHQLSVREREIVRYVADGSTAPNIASQLFLSRRTVESHIASAYRKLGVSSRAALAKALAADPALLEG